MVKLRMNGSFDNMGIKNASKTMYRYKYPEQSRTENNKICIESI